MAGITDNIDGTRSQTFAYDSVNRLLSAATTSTATTSAAHCWGENYSYDQWANFTSLAPMTGSYAGCSTESGFNFSNGGITTQNQISCSGFGYCYDAAGNLMSISGSGGGTFTYNAENQLTAVSMNAGGSAGYVYDGDSDRIEKTSGGSATKLYWGGLDETDGTGSTTNSAFSEYIMFSGQRIARLDSSGNVYYYAADHLGSTRVMAEVPAGQSAATLCYDADFYPYGGERAYTTTCQQNYKFTGQERDSESNLDNFLARYDSSQIGRFMSPDPENAGADLGDPQTLNMYAYVRNNPLNMIDPTGMQQSRGNEPADSCDGTGTGFEECIGAFFNCAYIDTCNPRDPRTWPEPHASGSCLLNGVVSVDCASVWADLMNGSAAVCPGGDCSKVRTGPDGQFQIQIDVPASQCDTGFVCVGATHWVNMASSWDASQPTPNDPSGLGPDWRKNPQHKDPNGDEYINDKTGEKMEWNKGRPGQFGPKTDRGRDGWHYTPPGGVRGKQMDPGTVIKATATAGFWTTVGVMAVRAGVALGRAAAACVESGVCEAAP